MDDFFISYSNSDKSWAEWIAWTLEEAGYSCRIQAWDFKPGKNFILEMDSASQQCKRTVAVVTKDYFASLFTQSEWAQAFAADPRGMNQKLLPVRVAPCEVPGLLSAVIYCDLVGLDESSARAALLDAVDSFKRCKPLTAPKYPVEATALASSLYAEGAVSQGSAISGESELLGLLDTTLATFVAQCRMRDDLVKRIESRLQIRDPDEYDLFFSRYFDDMDRKERFLHANIRNYTQTVLSKCNARILELLKEHPGLLTEIPLVHELKHHLTVWLAKYEGFFQYTPSMCLVYVGVHEGMPFPVGVQDAVRAHLGLAPVNEHRGAENCHETQNLEEWYYSGEPHQWVQARRGFWDHDAWLCLIEGLKRSAFWPMDVEEIGFVLEKLKELYLDNPEFRHGGRRFAPDKERHHTDRHLQTWLSCLRDSEHRSRYVENRSEYREERRADWEGRRR